MPEMGSLLNIGHRQLTNGTKCGCKSIQAKIPVYYNCSACVIHALWLKRLFGFIVNVRACRQTFRVFEENVQDTDKQRGNFCTKSAALKPAHTGNTPMRHCRKWSGHKIKSVAQVVSGQLSVIANLHEGSQKKTCPSLVCKHVVGDGLCIDTQKDLMLFAPIAFYL